METYIVLIPLENNREARSQCETIENIHITMPQPSAIQVRDRILTFLEDGDSLLLTGIEVEPITDFMDRVNDEEFNVDNYFMSYVNVHKFHSF